MKKQWRGAPALRPRSILLAIAAVIGLGGLAAGLTRLGVWSPVTGARLADHHGTLMVLGFVGTLAGLEAAKGRWRYVAPAGTLFASIALMAGAPLPLAAGTYVAAMVILMGAYVADSRLIEALGAGAGAGAAVLLCRDVAPEDIALWWVSFVVLIVVGTIDHALRDDERAFWGALAVLVATAWSAIAASGTRALGACLLALVGLALAGNRRAVGAESTPSPEKTLSPGDKLSPEEGPHAATITSSGNVMLGILSGYLWVVVAAGVLLLADDWRTGYDIVIQAIMLGFLGSMILARVPDAALTRRTLVPLLLLDSGVIIRIIGTLTGSVSAMRAGVIAAAFGFLAILVIALRQENT
ncbi:MAG: hypothetical protein E7Z96_04825 [Actinomycetaceae bacterium]|nr:hypothetical protein [Actinomycetaceae bacterium]